MCGNQRPHIGQHCSWPFVLEALELLLQPARALRRPFAPDCRPDLPHILRRVRKVQNPHRIRTMIIDEPLHPLGPIRDRNHFPGLLDPPPLDLRQRQPGEGLRFQQPRKVAQLSGMHVLFRTVDHRLPKHPHHQRFHFRPRAPN
jgi:hypothetical protein